jgi:arabinoxylan arabinofuranohydrolase
MTSDKPMGPWTYHKTILKNPGHFFGVSGNNHHAIFEFKDVWYIAYHAQTLSKARGVANGYRSTHLNRLVHNEDGSIQEVEADYKGVKQVQYLDPFKRVEGATIGWSAGVNTETEADSGARIVTGIENGDWIGLSWVDFGQGAVAFSASVISLEGGGTLELHLDEPSGLLIGKLPVPAANGSEQQMELKKEVSTVKGIHDLYLVFKGELGIGMFKLVSWQFLS